MHRFVCFSFKLGFSVCDVSLTEMFVKENYVLVGEFIIIISCYH